MILKKPLDRRSLLKGAGTAALGLGATSLLPARRAGAQPTELNMLSWYGHAEPDAIGEFEAQFNVTINKKYYVGGDQMLALLAQSPPGTYDVILTDREYVVQLVAADMIEKLDPEDYPIDDFFPEFQNMPGHWQGDDLYSVMLRFGYLGLSYNEEALAGLDVSSYGVMWDDALIAKVGHFDWHLPNFGCVSLYQGNEDPFNLNQAQWDALAESTFSLKPQVAGFFDYGGVLSSLRSGQVLAIPGIGDWITGVLRREGAPVATVVPDEGGLLWAESLSIGKGSSRPELARDFIQYMLSPAGQVRTATLDAYPALLPTRAGWAALQDADSAEAKRQGMVLNGPNALDLLRQNRIKLRALPVQQSLEDWNDAWSRYKNI
ncbi:MAG: spermidine/putrescine ABC transporter substrate-binding protein [Phyllobacteriaceae bacterium]|jgi:spermidine/putrescine transport system substrate-binding protein|nr:spermidine/putrescine ABC transporter substrate-binding protein [Phyllobacteriaceae bacterium]